MNIGTGFFDKYTLEIIVKFVDQRRKIRNLQDVYDDIFRLLIQYILDNNKYMDIENKEEQRKYEDSFHIKIYNKIFQALSINITLDSMDEVWPLMKRSYDADITLAKQLGIIICDMMENYEDPPE